MRAVLPPNLMHFDQPQVCLVDKRRRLQRVTAPLAPHVPGGHAAQFLVDERQERVERAGVALIPGEEQRRRAGTRLGNGSILMRIR
jgi:hypothetical protein